MFRRTALGWHNFRHRWLRTLAALCGIATAIQLLFLQYGLYRGGCQGSVLLLNQFDYDLAIVPRQYRFIGNSATVDRERISQVLAVEGVRRSAPFFLGEARWLDDLQSVKREVLVVGVDPASQPFRMAKANSLLPQITRPDTALIDRKTGSGFDNLTVGRSAEFSGRRLDLVDEYKHGIGILGDAAIIVSDQTFSHLISGSETTLTRMTLGFVWLDPGADRSTVMRDLRSVLPHDVQVLDREMHLQIEENFLMREKPIGVMFITGLWLAIMVGGVILYQILAVDVENRMPEFATMKALGYSNWRICSVVWQQALIFAVAGYLPALASAIFMYHMINTTTTVPAEMDLDAMSKVLALTVIMACIAGALSLRKLAKADPADLF